MGHFQLWVVVFRTLGAATWMCAEGATDIPLCPSNNYIATKNDADDLNKANSISHVNNNWTLYKSLQQLKAKIE